VSGRRLLTLALATAAACLAAVPALANPIESKRAEAQRVLNEIHSLDVQLEKAIESYDAATVKLDQIHRQLRVNRFEIGVAKRNLTLAQQRLGARLRDLYIQGAEASTLEVILGATSLDDLLNRLDTVDRVSNQDTQVLQEVRIFRSEVQRRGAVLKQANAEQQRVVAERAATKRQIESGLAERQRMLSSIKDEIVKLKAEEAHRQQVLAAQARARLVQIQQQRREQLQGSALGVAAVTPDGPSVLPPARYGGVVGIAMQYLGTPYVWGGASPAGFDCSGFVMYVFAQVGVSLPHNAAAIYGYGVYVPKSQLQPGDLVFFDGLGHMGIYIGGGQFIHSPHTGDVVKISSLSESWYASTYVGAKRVT
jgi:cell wall-associated NlpC family hydrolase